MNNIPREAISENTEIEYPTILDRIKAYTMDTLFVIILSMAVTSFFSNYDNIPENVRVITFISIFCLYDPILISLFGATMGHSMMNISVKREDNYNKNIKLHVAIFRFLFKVFLGWISFLTASRNKKRMAIHDIVAKSIVIYN